MKNKCGLFIVLILLFAFTANCASPTNPAAEEAAVAAASAWLTLVDKGNYLESWDEAAQVFRVTIEREQWQTRLKTVRTLFGKVTSRELRSKKYTEELPGSPDGQYVVIQYTTSFEYKKSAIETVTPMLDRDGRWRVSGYYIK